MIKLSLLLLTLLTSVQALAWEDYSRRDPYGTDNRDNTPKSYTLSGDTYRQRRESLEQSNSQSYSNPSRESNRASNGSYRSGSQINNNGLIINRD